MCWCDRREHARGGSVPLVVSDHRVTRHDRADGGSRRADERASSINDDSAKAGKAVAIEGRKLRAEIVDDERPLAGGAAIMWARHVGFQITGFQVDAQIGSRSRISMRSYIVELAGPRAPRI